MTVRRARSIALPLCAWLAVAPGLAVDAGQVPRLAVPRAAVPPVIDGALDDACWRSAAVIAGLGPARDAVAPAAWPRTVVRIAWDPAALHLAFACRDDDIHVLPALGRDDDIYKGDVCEVFIDGVGDQRQWIEVQMSPLNQVLDLVSILTAPPAYTDAMRLTPDLVERELWSDRSWSAAGLATASGRIVEDGATVGWTVEMSIPAGAFLRRAGRDRLSPMDLRANVLRYDHPVGNGKRELVQMNWAPVATGCPHISPAAMGVLHLVESDPGHGQR